MKHSACGWIVGPCIHALALLLLMTIAPVGGIGRAEAHAVLEQAQPSDRSVQIVAPKAFSLQFDEPVGVTDLRLLDATGRSLAIKPQADNVIIRADIVDPLVPGTYTIAYRIISADGHPVAGALQFQVGAGQSHWLAADEALAWWQWGKITCLLALYLAGFTFWSLCVTAVRRHADPRRAAAFSSLIVILAACLLIGFQGAGMTGSAVDQLPSRAGWAGASDTAEGRLALLFILALAFGWLALYLSARPRLALVLVILSAVALVLSLSTAGHVAVLGWLQVTVLTGHVVFALIWTGSLRSLLKRLRQGESTPAPPRPRRYASAYVILGIGASGIGLACWQVVEPGLLLSTAYGLVLAAKIGAVVALVVIIWINRRLSRGADRSVYAGSIWTISQIGLLVIVLGLTATLGQLTPPRHLLKATPPIDSKAGDRVILESTVHAADAMAAISLRQLPGQRYRVMVRLVSMSGATLTPQQVSLALSNPAAQIGPLGREMVFDPDAKAYVSSPLDLLPGGRWRIDVTVDVTDFDRRHFVMEATVPTATTAP